MSMAESSEVARTIASYDRGAADFAGRAANFRPERALAAFAACVPAGGLVLDAGSGPGRDCATLTELGFRPVALDLSHGMLAEGRRRGLTAPAAQADLRRLPFADGCFSGVWASASLLHLPRTDLVPTLREFARIIGRGCLYLALKEGEGEAWQERPGGPRFFRYYRMDAVEAAVHEAGFEVTARWSGPPGSDGYPWLNLIAIIS
jgi:SAM-dependent methyltransferase